MHTTIFNDKIDFTAMICSFFRFFLKSKFSQVFRNLNEINEWANDCGFFIGFFFVFDAYEIKIFPFISS